MWLEAELATIDDGLDGYPHPTVFVVFEVVFNIEHGLVYS